MATKRKPPARAEPIAESRPFGRHNPAGPDARGMVRVYADLNMEEATELAVLAARRRLSKKAMLELLIREATKQKVGV